MGLPPSANSITWCLPSRSTSTTSLRGQRVDDRHADAVEAAGDLVALAAELAAAVQLGEGDLDAGHLLLLVDVGGDAAAVVDHPAAAVGQQRDVDPGGVAGHRLVDGVVDDLPHAVVQAASVRWCRCTSRGASGRGRGPPGPACCWPRRSWFVCATKRRPFSRWARRCERPGGAGVRTGVGRRESPGQTPNHNRGSLPAGV